MLVSFLLLQMSVSLYVFRIRWNGIERVAYALKLIKFKSKR